MAESSTKKIYDVIVVGGGAAGMMAAGTAAQRGKSVLLLERNKNLGEKLKITGGGRCNITNAEYNQRLLLSHYATAQSFLHSAFVQFGVEDTFDFFEKLGVPLVVQAGKRAFPKTEKALDVAKALEKYLKTNQVEVKTNCRISGLVPQGNKIEKVVCGKQEFFAKSFILATGGASHPETGSTGDGFGWLEKLGHTVKAPTPTIVPLAVEDDWVKALAGVTLPEVKITFFSHGKKQLVLKGNILMTHFGLSGPLILNAAHHVDDLTHAGAVNALIDVYPGLDLGALDKKITNIFNENKNKVFKNVFKLIAPKGTATVLLQLVPQINSELLVNSITKAQRKELVNLLKHLPVAISGLMGYDKAVVADGGIELKQVDAKTMRSKLYSNLFVTGDLLNIRRPSGGYSLQLCWTTGFVAGNHG